jgi:DNA modification methylase
MIKGVKPYYESDGVWLYHGDCRELLPLIPNGSVDLVLTDPPYGIGYDGTWLTSLHIERGKPANKCDAKMVGDDGLVPLEMLWRFPRRMIWGFPYLHDPAATGWIVWDKQPGVARRGITAPVECASTTCRKGWDVYRCMWGGYMREAGEIRYKHPTQKPMKVCLLPIDEWTTADETVLDPFAGSGTTLVAACKLSRQAIGIEIEERYCEIAAKRLEAADRGISVKELEHGQRTLFKAIPA